MLAIIHASQLVTLRGPERPRVGAELRELSIIEDGAVLVDYGHITHIGTTDEIRRQIPADATVIDAGGRVVMPGFVDAHTHLVFAGHRVAEFEMRALGESYLSIAAKGGGIRNTVSATRAASEDELFIKARTHAAIMLRNGTTTAEAKSGYGLSLESELKILRVIKRLDNEGPLRLVPTFLGAHVPGPEFDGRTDDYVAHVVADMLPAVADAKLARYCDVFCEAKAFSIEQSRRIMTKARALGFGLRMHVDQITPGFGGAELAAELQAFTADHLEQTGDAGIAALKRAGVTPVLLPPSVFALGLSKYPAARAMIGAGLPIVVATDFNPGSSPTPSIPMVLSLAVTQMKLTPAEAIAAATVNAAHSLGLGNELGTLEPDRRADIVIHDCTDVRELAVFFGFDTAHTVVTSGRVAFTRTAP